MAQGFSGPVCYATSPNALRECIPVPAHNALGIGREMKADAFGTIPEGNLALIGIRVSNIASSFLFGGGNHPCGCTKSAENGSFTNYQLGRDNMLAGLAGNF